MIFTILNDYYSERSKTITTSIVFYASFLLLLPQQYKYYLILPIILDMCVGGYKYWRGPLPKPQKGGVHGTHGNGTHGARKKVLRPSNSVQLSNNNGYERNNRKVSFNPEVDSQIFDKNMPILYDQNASVSPSLPYPIEESQPGQPPNVINRSLPENSDSEYDSDTDSSVSVGTIQSDDDYSEYDTDYDTDDDLIEID